MAWDAKTHLLATIADILIWANYQRADGKGPKPKPIPRPGDQDADKEEHRLGTPVSIEEAREILDNWGR